MTAEIIVSLTHKVNANITAANAPQDLKDAMLTAAADVSKELTSRINSCRENTVAGFVKAIYFSDFAPKLGGGSSAARTAWAMFSRVAAEFDRN